MGNWNWLIAWACVTWAVVALTYDGDEHGYAQEAMAMFVFMLCLLPVFYFGSTL